MGPFESIVARRGGCVNNGSKSDGRVDTEERREVSTACGRRESRFGVVLGEDVWWVRSWSGVILMGRAREGNEEKRMRIEKQGKGKGKGKGERMGERSLKLSRKVKRNIPRELLLSIAS